MVDGLETLQEVRLVVFAMICDGYYTSFWWLLYGRMSEPSPVLHRSFGIYNRHRVNWHIPPKRKRNIILKISLEGDKLYYHIDNVLPH